MGDLNNKYIDESYGSLLKTTEDTGLSGNTKTTVQDGNGTDTSLKISTEVVDVNGDLQTSGTTRVQGDGELVNVSGNISQFTNDSGYLDGLPVDVLRIGDNVSELNNNSGYLTAGTLPSNVMKEGENVSLLTNDAGYLTSIPSNVMLEGENNSLLNNDSGYISSIPNTYLESGDNVSELVNDSGYLTSIPANVMLEGENNSLLNNDSGFITGINTGVIEISGGGGVQQAEQPLTDQDGTATGQFIWPVNGAVGNENDSTISNNSYYFVKNNRWDILNSPLDTINSFAGYYILDENNQSTYNIIQNRFGGVNYYNAVSGQDHIFGGGGGGGLIRMNSFNSDNNSNNWYEAYNANLTSVSLNGSDLEFGSRNNGQIASITLPAGGGGGLVGINYSNDTDINAGEFMRTLQPIKGLIYTAASDSYDTGDKMFLYPFSYKSGDVLNTLGFQVKSFTNISNAYVAVYNSNGPDNKPGDLVGGSQVSINSTGMKFVENLSMQLDTNTTNIYWFAIYQNGGDFRLGMTAEGNATEELFSLTRLKVAPGYTGNTTLILSQTLTSLPTDLSSSTFQENPQRMVFGMIGA